MLVSIDKRGSISLPAAVRKDPGLVPGTYLDLSILDGGRLALSPVTVYPTVRLSEEGLAKLDEARQSGVDQLPDWLHTRRTRSKISVPSLVGGSWRPLSGLL